MESEGYLFDSIAPLTCTRVVFALAVGLPLPIDESRTVLRQPMPVSRITS